MKIAALTTAVVAALAVSAVAAPSSARPYGYGYSRAAEACQETQHNQGATGAVLGGLAGALLGANVAGHGSKAGGAALGAVAGAVVGGSIGRSNGRSSDACDARDRHEAYYRQDGRYAPYAGGDRRGYARPAAYYGRNQWPAYDPYSY